MGAPYLVTRRWAVGGVQAIIDWHMPDECSISRVLIQRDQELDGARSANRPGDETFVRRQGMWKYPFDAGRVRSS
jgi:hypothetical protein